MLLAVTLFGDGSATSAATCHKKERLARLVMLAARLPRRVSALARASPAARLPRRALATKVMVCGDESAYDSAVANDSGAVVYFTATWCGPCRMISPIFEELASSAEASKTFLKVDVDDQPEIAAAAQVTAMPTFHFYKAGKLLDKMVGADVNKLQDLTKAHLLA